MPKQPYEIIFEDEHMLVANKHSGLLTIPDRYRPDLLNLYQLLQNKYGEIFVVHRLDKGTSGLVCFAKTAEAHRLLSLQFEAREPIKRYQAIVKGTPNPTEGVIEAGLAANKEGGMRIDIKRGKASTTEYRLLESFDQFSLVEATILTGRTHQIRVHLQHLGHPLAVDHKYTKVEKLFLSEIKRKKFNLKKQTEERPLLSRVPLHAYFLSLIHPITKEQLDLTSDLPKDMRAVLNQMRKWSNKS